MSDKSRVWIEYAKRDLKSAENLLDDEYVANSVMLHCHQAVEKVLKAVLASNDIKIPRIHGITKLYGMLPEKILKTLNLDNQDIEILDEIYIDSRYPADIGILPSGFPSKSDAEKVFIITQKIFLNILKILE